MGRKIGTFFSIINLVLEVFVALFLTPLIIRSFGQAEYGVYTLVLSVTAYLALLDLGVGHAVVKFISKFRANNQIEEQRKVLGITTAYFVIIAIIAFIFGAAIYMLFPTLFGNGLTNEEIVLARKLLLITIANVMITLGTSSFYYTAVAYENHYISKGLLALVTFLRAIIAFVLVKSGFRSVEICLITTSSTLVFRMFVVIYVLFKMRIVPVLRGSKSINIKEIIFFSTFVLIQMIAHQINNVTDQVLIGALVTSSSVILGIYGVGAQINTYFQSIGGALNGVLMPGVVRMVELNATTQDIQDEMIRIGRYNFMFVGIIWVVFLINGRNFILLWSGEENLEAYFVALMLMLPYVFIITENIGTQVLWAYNKHKKQAILKLVVVLTNILLTVFLIRWNPLYGATIGTFISLMIGDVFVMQVVFKQDIGISLSCYYKGLLKGILISLIVTGFVGFFTTFIPISGWIGFAINCFIMILVYLLCMVTFGLNAYEKSFFGKIIKKLFGGGHKTQC